MNFKDFDFEKLREFLPRDYRWIIADRLDVSYGAVYQASKGEMTSMKILRELVKLAEETCNEFNAMSVTVRNFDKSGKRHWVINYLSKNGDMAEWGDMDISAKELPCRSDLTKMIEERLNNGSKVWIIGMMEFATKEDALSWRR